MTDLTPKAAAAGFIGPAGDDLISNGDDAITTNANITAELIEQATWFTKQRLNASQALLNLSNGVHEVWNGNTAAALGLPVARVGLVTVSRFGTEGNITFDTRDQYTYERWVALVISDTVQEWTKLEPIPEVENWWNGSTPVLPDTDILSLPNGIHTLWSTVTALSMGLPNPSLGSLEVARWGTGAGWIKWTTRTNPPTVWMTVERSKNVLDPWVRIDGSGSASNAAPASSGFKVVPLALTRGNGGGTKAATAGSVRIPLRFNAPIVRWRVHMVDGNPRSSQRLNTTFDITGMFVGDDAGAGAMDNIVPLGSFSKSAATGDDLVTPWFTDPIGDDQTRMLSFGYTASTAPIALAGGAYLSTDSSDAGGTSGTWTRSETAPFDIWIEAETYAGTPVIAVIGDSLSCGIGTTMPVQHSMLSKYARDHGALPVHYAHSGDTIANSLSATADKYARWTNLARADACLVAIGSNDIFALGATLNEMETRHAEIVELASRYISPNVYIATITPRDAITGDKETIRRSFNTYLESARNVSRQTYDFVSPVSTDDETLRPEYSADGTHLTAAGYTAQAASITVPMTSPAPAYR